MASSGTSFAQTLFALIPQNWKVITMPTLAELQKDVTGEPTVASRTNPEILVSDIRNRMRSTEIIDRKLQDALLSRGGAARSIRPASLQTKR
jgi:hypothetical protein